MPTFTYGSDTSGSTNSITWTSWTCVAGNTSDVSADGTVWLTWTDISSGSNTNVAQPTTEEMEAKQQEKLEAKNRAEVLLKLCLTEEQREHLEEMSYFVIESEMGKNYRIKYGRVQNIDELDDNGNRVALLCAHPVSKVPDFDTMLAQKLMLETNEAEFLRIANRRLF